LSLFIEILRLFCAQQHQRECIGAYPRHFASIWLAE